MSQEHFLARARARHGDRFDYRHCDYQRFTAPIRIGCPVHGEFTTTPKQHLATQSGGCRQCVRRQPGPTVRARWAKRFLDQARQRHGDRYDYCDTVYRGPRKKITVRCHKHGPFLIPAGKHLAGRGCRTCSREELSRERRLSVWGLVERIVAAHGLGHYDYRLQGYVNLFSKLSIRCHRHGWFQQSAGSHIKGSGCPRCCSSRGERRIRHELGRLGITFQEQVRFPDCRDRGQLAFDFYLPAYNVLIEYDGKQHFQKSELWGGRHVLETTQRHDAIKTAFSASHGYQLVRIPYWEFRRIPDVVRSLVDSPVIRTS